MNKLVQAVIVTLSITLSFSGGFGEDNLSPLPQCTVGKGIYYPYNLYRKAQKYVSFVAKPSLYYYSTTGNVYRIEELQDTSQLWQKLKVKGDSLSLAVPAPDNKDWLTTLQVPCRMPDHWFAGDKLESQPEGNRMFDVLDRESLGKWYGELSEQEKGKVYLLDTVGDLPSYGISGDIQPFISWYPEGLVGNTQLPGGAQ